MIKEFHPQLLPRIRKLSIKANRNFLSRTLTGNWLSTFKGRGIEFSDYRQYTSGDDASMIDWRASLRARKVLVKELTEEKNLNVFVLFDVSNSMLYGSQDLLKAEFAAELVSGISYAALRAGDSAGLVMYSDEIKRYLAPSIGMRQHNLIQDVLADAKNYGGASDLPKVLSHLMGATKQRGIIIIISDFIALPERWNKYLEIASARFQIVGLMVRDPRDRKLPAHAGEYVLEDPYSDERLIIDCATYAAPYAKYVEREEELIRESFRQIKGDLMLIETDSDYMRPLMRFFHRRALQVDH